MVRYDVPDHGGAVSLRIYDVGGRLVRTLVEGTLPAGEKSVVWDGRDDTGRPVGSGVYFCRLAAANYRETHKMVLMK
jgi:flagellar hook assembly protein FlgD